MDLIYGILILKVLLKCVLLRMIIVVNGVRTISKLHIRPHPHLLGALLS